MLVFNKAGSEDELEEVQESKVCSSSFFNLGLHFHVLKMVKSFIIWIGKCIWFSRRSLGLTVLPCFSSFLSAH